MHINISEFSRLKIAAIRFMALGAAAAALLLCAREACCAFIGPGSQTVVNNVADALKAADDTPCILEGRIEAKIPNRKNRYIFSDNSGKIIVEIKKKIFADLVVTPKNIVRIEGEVEWDSKHDNEIEAEYLSIIR